MAKLMHCGNGQDPVNSGEERLIKFLEVNLPDDFLILSNIELAYLNPKNLQVQYLEYDCIVVTPHAIYNIENKDFSGRLEGDDNYWYLNDRETRNPHKTLRFKTSVLASKLKEKNGIWAKAWIQSLVSLSHPHQSTKGLWGAHTKATYILDDKLINIITDAGLVGRDNNELSTFYKEIAEEICGTTSLMSPAKKTEVEGYEILEILDQEPNYIEYLVKPKGVTSAIRKRIREYALDIPNLPLEQREKRNRLIQNQYNALNKIKTNPFILNVQFKLDQESHTFYEITDFLDESSLRAELKRKTFTLDEKINVILNLISALKAAHEQNVFHRDISAENVFIAGGYACLGNFGKSYFTDHQDDGYTVMPTINEATATPYHALELASRDASRASDIYSLAILTYELFVDKVPVESPFELNRLGGKLPFERKPTSVNPGVPNWLDEFCDHTILTDPDERWDNLEEMETFLKKAIKPEETVSISNTTIKTDECSFEIGSRILEYTIYQHIGHGGYSQVYKVKHNLQSKSDYAMKVFNESVHASSVTDEYNALIDLNHPNIVKFRWNGVLPTGQFYTLMELLDGENLKEYAKGSKSLPIYKVFQVAKDILDALVYMQKVEPPIYHRDIKPQNIVWDQGKRFVLIDFNVASVVENNLDHVGTNPYLAPDLTIGNNRVNWDSSADTFALGVTLYELACKTYPWSGSMKMPQIAKAPDDPQLHNTKLSLAFSTFLLKSIATNKLERFSSAKEMLDNLLSIGENALLQAELPTISLELPEKELDHDIVSYINSLYSQSRHGNVGTRAGDKNLVFDNLTYTETKLDKQLIPDILDGRYKLVVITGNAGDGKTAFIRKIESKAQNVKKLAHGNGVTFTINGLTYQSNYDGSQDEDQKANDEVLSAFFKPFEFLSDYSKANEGRLIAINEGRLVEFLHTVAPYKQLADTIENYFYTEGKVELPEGLLIINLNLRSVVASTPDQDSLFKQQVKLLTKRELWSKCDSCSAAGNCFIKYNVNSLNDSAAGDEIIERMEWLLRTVSLKRELHVTMRDLRSFIAFMLTRDFKCQEINSLSETMGSDYISWWKLYYFNISDSFANDTAEQDRLIKLIRETDVAETAVPSLDRDLYFGLHKQENFLDFEERTESLLHQFNDRKIMIPLHDQTDQIQKNILTVQKLVVRHQYFEGKINYRSRLPYHSVFDFHDLLIGNKGDYQEIMTKTKQSIAKAISLNEGCNNEAIYAKNLVLSSAQVKDPLSKSFRLFSLNGFELIINSSLHLTNYLEYEPDSLIFRSIKDKKVALTISLDLFEMLYFISQGYSPSLNDIRGRFVELQIFKNLLENQEYKEVIVTDDNELFYSIKINNQNKLEVEPLS